MASVTLLKRSITFYQDFDPQRAANLQRQLEDLQAKRKARRLARKSPPVVAFPGTFSQIPLHDNFELEAKLFTQQVMKQQDIPGKLVLCTRKTSFAQKRGMEVHLGSQSIRRAAIRGFTEYKQLQRMIWPFQVTGISGVRLLVLHELAHLLVFKNYNHRTQPHGSEYQREYAKLLHIYQSALTRRPNN